MEKISKIVPSNSRIEAVDLTKNKSGRSSVPGLNQTESIASSRLPGAHLSAVDRIKFTDQYKMLKPDEARHMQIAQKTHDNFFNVYTKTGNLNKVDSTEQKPSKPDEESLKMSDTEESQIEEIVENMDTSTLDEDLSMNNKTISLYA